MSSPASADTERTYEVAAVTKALRVLDVFATPPHRFGLTEVSARTGLSTNQAYRLLFTLVASGFARQDPVSKLYSLGPRVFGLVRALTPGDELVLAAQEALEWVHAETDETVAIMMPDGDEETICVDVRESSHSLLVSSPIGSRGAELHTGAVGRLLLSARPDDAIRRYLAAHTPLRRYTRHTPTTEDAVWTEITRVRAEDFSISNEEIAEGMYGSAAPIRDCRGEVVGAITIAAPVSRAGASEREHHRTLLTEAARRASLNLGYRAEAAPD